MNSAPNNPAANALGPGVKEQDLADAIAKSGYPLQTVVASLLRKDFGVTEEWSYIDRDTKELRTIDIQANKRLYDFHKVEPRVRPQLNFLIECKQSNLPYVFFLSPGKPWLPKFPVLAGLAKDDVTITSDDDPSSWTFPVINALELDRHKFVTQPPYSTTISKSVRKGSDLELSGSESYNSLVLPLVKSLGYFQIAEAPPETAYYFDAHLTIAIGVLDAPMVGVQVTQNTNDLILLPWVRVLRGEAIEAPHATDRSRLVVVDVVHKDFLDEYVHKHVIPFAEEFARLAMEHEDILATGDGFVSGMGKDSWQNIRARLQRKTTKARVIRAAAGGRNVIRALRRKKS